ncbi:MAG: twin-arginine translocase TatA/TatE family subunit [Bacteroidaceae bacterium]|nr:twin-arginine translocase TatA/TatE family subunit [Bacteroidaceae bacterium]
MNNLLFLGGIGMQEILVILLIVLLFYGGKKVPEMMRGLGQGVKAFKDGMDSPLPTSPKGEEKTADTEVKKEESGSN